MSLQRVSTPFASVLMLAYNHAPYLEKSIQCILDQRTNFPFELIIGEDCSTDATREIALNYQRNNPHIIKVITSENNVGALENLRRIENASRGKYVSYCEGDDYWHEPNKLQQQVEFLESRPEYVMVHSDFRTVYTNSGLELRRTIGVCHSLNDSHAFDEILAGSRIVYTLTACIRSSVLKAVLKECPECYDRRFRMGDTQRWLEVSRRGKVRYDSEVSATRLILSESATQSKSVSNKLRFALSAKDVLDHYIEKYGCSNEVRNAAYSRSALQLLSYACALSDKVTANSLLSGYRKLELPIPFRAYLFALGSRSDAMKILITPIIRTTEVGAKLTRRAQRSSKFLKSLLPKK